MIVAAPRRHSKGRRWQFVGGENLKANSIFAFGPKKICANVWDDPVAVIFEPVNNIPVQPNRCFRHSMGLRAFSPEILTK